MIGAANPYWQCSGRFDLVKPCTNVLLHDETLSEMWRIIMTKLTTHADDVLLPLIGQLEKIGENSANTADSARLNEIRMQKMTLRKMCAEGLIAYSEVLNAETGLNAEYAAISEKMRRRSESSTTLIGEINTLYKAVLHDQGLKTDILKAVRITYDTACFELVGGIHFTVNVPKRDKRIFSVQEPIKVIRSLALCGKCGGRISRRKVEGIYLWKCQNRRCQWWKIKHTDEEMLAHAADVYAKVRCNPRLIRLRCPATEYRPTKQVIEMQESLEKLITSDSDTHMLIKAAVDLAVEKYNCIEFNSNIRQTEKIVDAFENSSGLSEFIAKTVKHIYITPDRVRVKFINGKTVKSERSTNHE